MRFGDKLSFDKLLDKLYLESQVQGPKCANGYACRMLHPAFVEPPAACQARGNPAARTCFAKATCKREYTTSKGQATLKAIRRPVRPALQPPANELGVVGCANGTTPVRP